VDGRDKPGHDRKMGASDCPYCLDGAGDARFCCPHQRIFAFRELGKPNARFPFRELGKPNAR
jgi:hypothetical protein